LSKAEYLLETSMAVLPDFSVDTKEQLMFRASLICTNPSCATITLGPSDAVGKLSLKLGEAAHIQAARPGQARYDPNMSDAQRADPTNGIWLCASCHSLIDKNQGADFPVAMLLEWKRKHEDVLRSLLHSHRSVLPLIRKFTEEGQIAQDVVDTLENHGALFMDRQYEVDQHVLVSIDHLRTELRDLAKRVRYDGELKGLIKDLVAECRSFMNHTSRFGGHVWPELESMRTRVGVIVLRLREDYGCKVRGRLNRIIP
jgi:hypothetical protein